MTADRRAEAERFRRIDSAFRSGDLEALQAAVDDPAAVPNGRMHDAIGSCLVYAIYHSPIDLIRTLLEIGADPNAPADDGFPPLIAALSCSRAAPGATPRSDVDEILRLLLLFGADANQRGINDYTPLHMAVAERHPYAVQILLDAGADPELRTRIDEYETAWGPVGAARLADDGATLFTEVRIDRDSLINGLFYGVEGMRVGGIRRLEIAPHLNYGERGVPDVVPANALLRAEITILAFVPGSGPTPSRAHPPRGR